MVDLVDQSCSTACGGGGGGRTAFNGTGVTDYGTSGSPIDGLVEVVDLVDNFHLHLEVLNH